jgi:endonuclease YncB( thermonuclease family)
VSGRSHAIWLGVGSIVLLVASGCGGSEQSSASPAAAGRTPPAVRASVETTPVGAGVCALAQDFCTDTAGMERGLVVKIIDGDTLDVTIGGRPERVRIFGIDTAERGEMCFAEASDRLRSLAGAEVRLLPDARERDRNGRLLRYVYTPAGTSVDAVMIAEGLAHAWTRDGALRDPLVALEASANVDGRGCLWGG